MDVAGTVAHGLADDPVDELHNGCLVVEVHLVRGGGGALLIVLVVERQDEAIDVARHLMRAVAQWATQRGAVRAYLQVEEGNTAAVGLYQGLGFSTHHTYLTREAPVPARS